MNITSENYACLKQNNIDKWQKSENNMGPKYLTLRIALGAEPEKHQ